MTRTAWAALFVVVTVSLAGCGDDGGDAAGLTQEDCEAQGLVLGEKMVMDNSTGEHRGEPACVSPGPPATVSIVDLAATSSVYSTVTFGWVLQTDEPGELHTMDTQVRVATTSADEASLAGPDSYGVMVAQMQHQQFMDGQRYNASYRFEAEGTYYFRAYALVNGEDLWSAESTVTVGPVQPTGNSTTVTINTFALAQGVQPATASIITGDGIVFDNQDVSDYTISFTGPAEVADVFVAQQATSDPVVFTVPGSYSYSGTGTVPAFTIQGTINVGTP